MIWEPCVKEGVKDKYSNKRYTSVLISQEIKRVFRILKVLTEWNSRGQVAACAKLELSDLLKNHTLDGGIEGSEPKAPNSYLAGENISIWGG